MAVATYQDVATALGRDISDQTEQNQVEWWLTGIEMVLRGRLGDVASLDQDALLYVEAEAVAAKARRHGTEESSITVSVDDGSVTRRYDAPVGAADMTDEWWDLLDPKAASDAFTVTPYATRQVPVGTFRFDPWSCQ